MKREEPSGVADVGGLVDKSSATLAVYGEKLDPHEVTKLLGVEPTQSFPPGYRRGPRSPAIKHGAWFLRVEGVAPAGPDEHLKAVLFRLPTEAAKWQQLHASYRVEIRVGIHFDAWNRGFTLSSETLSRIHTVGAPMEFDIYAYAREDA